MVIDQETVEYFSQMHLHRDPEDIKSLIHSWLEIMYQKHEIDSREWIYNKDDIVEEFYTHIKKHGKNKTTI